MQSENSVNSDFHFLEGKKLNFKGNKPEMYLSVLQKTHMSHSLKTCFASKVPKMTHKISASFHARNHFVQADVHCAQKLLQEINSLKLHQQLYLQGASYIHNAWLFKNKFKMYQASKQDKHTRLALELKKKPLVIVYRSFALQTSQSQLNFKEYKEIKIRLW